MTIADTTFRVNSADVPAQRLPPDATPSAVGLHFEIQKNGISGDRVWLQRAEPPDQCPVRCASRRIRHLLRHGAPASTPLYVFYDPTGPKALTSRILTAMLRLHALQHAPDLSVSAASLRPTGATALLTAGVPIELIKLVGRWRSDEVFRYFHSQSNLTAALSQQLLDNAA